MIEQFKDTEMRNSGVIYNSTLEQIKKLYQANPIQAGELAISAIELVLTGDISSDDMMVSLLLEPMRKINENNWKHYDTKVEGQRNKKIIEMKLDKIAEMTNQGISQREIGERLGMSQQNVSYRVNVIKKSYPELLQTVTNNFTKTTKNLTNTTNILQTSQKNSTKITNNFTNLQTLQKSEIGGFVDQDKNIDQVGGREEPILYTKDFVF